MGVGSSTVPFAMAFAADRLDELGGAQLLCGHGDGRREAGDSDRESSNMYMKKKDGASVDGEVLASCNARLNREGCQASQHLLLYSTVVILLY